MERKQIKKQLYAQPDDATEIAKDKQSRQEKFARHKGKKRANPVAKDLLQSGFYQPRIKPDGKKREKNRNTLQKILEDFDENE